MTIDCNYYPGMKVLVTKTPPASVQLPWDHQMNAYVGKQTTINQIVNHKGVIVLELTQPPGGWHGFLALTGWVVPIHTRRCGYCGGEWSHSAICASVKMLTNNIS